ncbi:MAG TPA: FAD-dependent oxidoreductase [Gaiellaceae bacterium]|nr:FAD-dependent oxidoreductase [Gaiellaceae bacterium]
MGAKHASLWIETAPAAPHEPLRGSVDVDVAVVGAGIVGVTAAFLLKEAGARVALIERSRILTGVTGHTTAKLTSQHGLRYHDLARTFGEAKARLYAEANQAAIEFVADRTAALGIDAQLERRPAYVWAETDDERRRIEAEAAAASALGLPAAVVDDVPLPVPATGALVFRDQAQFHPRRFLLALAERIPGEGGHVFEETPVEGTGGGILRTPGGVVRAEHTILATHLPLADRGLLFARAFPYRGYVVALPVEEDGAPDGLFINAGSPTRSVRTALDGDGHRLLLVSGDGHKVGAETATDGHYEALEAWARERFPLGEARYRWSTQDYSSADGVPLVGRLHPATGRVWTATGFGGWGMTNGLAAAIVLADLVRGRESPWAEVFSTDRLRSFTTRRFLSENAAVARHLVGDRIARPGVAAAARLAPGEGEVVRVGGRHVAVSRTDDGGLTAVSAACTHLGCLVRWNAAERSWDCPCHGSRFAADGGVLNGPAVRPLERRDLPAEGGAA